VQRKQLKQKNGLKIKIIIHRLRVHSTQRADLLNFNQSNAALRADIYILDLVQQQAMPWE
jgi:hypothetical protein